MVLRRRLIALAVVALSGCLTGIADSVQPPCTKQYPCEEGWSCRVTSCIPDGSLEAGQACTLDVQCETGLECGEFVCRAPCTEYYDVGSCASGEYCEPALQSGATCDGIGEYCAEGTCLHPPDSLQDYRCLDYEGFCVAGDSCDVESHDGCSTGEVCVTIGVGVTACFPGCEIAWTVGDYADNCGGTPIAQRYCTPVGISTAERLVCLDTSLGADAGDACNAGWPVHCNPELACIDGVCRTLCEHNTTAGDIFCTSKDSARPFCCTFAPSDGDTYGVCGDAC